MKIFSNQFNFSRKNKQIQGAEVRNSKIWFTVAILGQHLFSKQVLFKFLNWIQIELQYTLDKWDPG